MEWQNCNFISISLSSQKVYLVENKSGNTTEIFSYPSSMSPAALSVDSSRTKAVLTLTEENGRGGIYIIHLNNLKAYRLPVKIPAPLQFTLAPDGKSAYFISGGAALYHLDITALSCKLLAQGEDAVCSGIVFENGRLYTIWESGGKGIATIFSSDGEILQENEISGIPTNLAVTGGQMIITFTESDPYGEGVVFLPEEGEPAYLTIQSHVTPYMPHIYPCSITLNRQADLGYVVHEDGGLISILDPINRAVHKTFNIGRSITCLHLLPDERFAIATSNMFADLSLIDLVNCKLIAISDSSEELSSLLAMV